VRRVEDRSVVGPLEYVDLGPLQSDLAEPHLLEIVLPYVSQVLAYAGETGTLTVVAADDVEAVVGLNTGLAPTLLGFLVQVLGRF